MKRLAQRFAADRSSAIALIFALSILPLVLLVALSIDYAFYVQSRSQASLAADSAATHAVRAADAIYTYELSKNDATAVADAEADGSKIGQNWFFAALDTMPRASIAGTPTITLTQNINGSAGFTASVSFAGTYPPFFASLFNHKNWNINGAAQAQSAYSYVEILMLLDNSSSMLIASSSAAMLQLEALTVCPSSGIEPNFAGNGWYEYWQHNPNTNNAPPVDVPESSITHYTPGTYQSSGQVGSSGAGYSAGTCNPGWLGTDGQSYTYVANGTYSPNPDYYVGSGGYTGTSAPPYSPCALACHTTTDPMQVPKTINAQGVVTAYQSVPGYSNDYYGIARQAGIQLRLDVVQSAAAAVITAMQANEQAASQFSVGVYEFNSDVSPVWPSASGGTQTGEASTDLTDAATAIQNIAPPVTPAANANTDFPDSINDMISGTYLNGTVYRTASGSSSALGLAASGTGNTAATPQKDVFIVTDGMEDSSSPNGAGLGEMTGYDAETGTPTSVTPALCGKLKTTLGYTVYVLYVDYNPLSNYFYQANTAAPTQYGDQDYPGLYYTRQYYAESTWYSAAYPPENNPSLATVSPDEAGLIGCATNPSDFFEATSDSDIGTAMNAMLHAALTSTIQLTQ